MRMRKHGYPRNPPGLRFARSAARVSSAPVHQPSSIRPPYRGIDQGPVSCANAPASVRPEPETGTTGTRSDLCASNPRQRSSTCMRNMLAADLAKWRPQACCAYTCPAKPHRILPRRPGEWGWRGAPSGHGAQFGVEAALVLSAAILLDDALVDHPVDLGNGLPETLLGGVPVTRPYGLQHQLHGRAHARTQCDVVCAAFDGLPSPFPSGLNVCQGISRRRFGATARKRALLFRAPHGKSIER